jgi:branched-chain amino acid transport system ATP-binding protein
MADGAVPQTQTLLEVKGLNVRYGAVTAIRDVDLEVREGETVALLGPNGAGKSSTLKTSAGSNSFDGHDVRRLNTERRVRLGMTLTPEGRHVFAKLTVAENLRLGGASQPARGTAETGEEMLELFPILRDRRQQLAGTLSGGQQQMLAVARSLMSKPKLLMLDEPSLGLAPKIVETIFELIVTLRSRGLTTLLVEQNVSMSLEVADRGYVLETGGLVLSGTADELRRSEDDLVRSYLGLAV